MKKRIAGLNRHSWTDLSILERRTFHTHPAHPFPARNQNKNKSWTQSLAQGWDLKELIERKSSKQVASSHCKRAWKTGTRPAGGEVLRTQVIILVTCLWGM